MKEPENTSTSSRRTFLKNSARTAAASAVLAESIPYVHAAENNTIEIALVGCGGRGTGAAQNALKTKSGPTKLVAMADVFGSRLKASLNHITRGYKKQVDVPPERQFVGFDGYKKAIDCLGKNGVVLLTTPPAFRPLHMEYAVEKNKNIFMEKSFAVDAPGIQRILKAGREADRKSLKVAGGLMSRHYAPLEQAVENIHKGMIGKVITCWAYREHHPVGFRPKQENETVLAHQIHNYSNFTWLNGSFLLDWLIHNLDVCCWVKDAWPVSAQGHGGRQVRTHPDQLFDHYAVEYRFPDGTRLFAQGRHMSNCWGFFGDIIHGATGSAVLGEGIKHPQIFKTHEQTGKNMVWDFKGGLPNPYDVEHELLFRAIRSNEHYNESERCAYAAMTGILGRMASESGKEITWEAAMDSKLVLAPGLADFTMDSPAPIMPDENGRYPIAKPGITKVV